MPWALAQHCQVYNAVVKVKSKTHALLKQCLLLMTQQFIDVATARLCETDVMLQRIGLLEQGQWENAGIFNA